jgi:hypothetical protein
MYDEFSHKVQARTKHIIELPYRPALWILRSEILLTLGYLELSIGDAHRERLLVGLALYNTIDLGQKAGLSFGMGGLINNSAHWAQYGLDSVPEFVDSGLRNLEEHLWR